MVPIIVVDDNMGDLQMAQRELLLARVLNPVYLCHGPESCLRFFKAQGEFASRQLPAIVLLDLVMGPINGVQLLQQLSQIPSARDSVFIMLSGLAEYKMIADGYAAGATTFIVKPLNSDELMKTLTANPRLAAKSLSAGLEVAIQGSRSGLISGAPEGRPPGRGA